MAIFAMPIILMIEADSIEDAQKNVDEWRDEMEDFDNLPLGTEDVDHSPQCDHNDEGQRLLYLNSTDIIDDDASDDEEDDNDDDFNDGEPLF